MDFRTSDFVASLALYQSRRDMALGLNHVTARQKGLVWYYNVLQKELFYKVAKSSFRHSAMQQIDKRMSEIMAEAQTAPIERRRELLKEAINLKKQAQRIKKIG